VAWRFSGDNIANLTPARLEDLKRILPPSNRTATPVDLFSSDTPSCLALTLCRTAGAYLLLAMINWSDHPASVTIERQILLDAFDAVPVRAWNLTEKAHRRYMGLHDWRARRQIGYSQRGPPLNHAGLLRAASDHPDLAFSTFHMPVGWWK